MKIFIQIPCFNEELQIGNTIQEIKKENTKIDVLFLDADENKQLMKSYEIQAVPGFIVFKYSKEFFRHTGVISKEELLVRLK